MKTTECEKSGNFRVRRNWYGKLILQIECKSAHTIGPRGQFEINTHWRDATESDVLMFRGTSLSFKID